MYVFHTFIFYSGCNGNIKLSSSEHEQITSFNSSHVAQQKRKKVKISLRDEETRTNLKFELATSTGDCCWKVWDRARGGRYHRLSTANTYQPGWPIRAIGLDSCIIPGPVLFL